MAFHQWSREQLLGLAKKLRIDVPPQATKPQITQLIADSPPKKWQLDEISKLAESIGREIPPDNLTYGRATDILEVGAEVLNARAIEAMNIRPDDIFFCWGRYFVVLQLLSAAERRMALLQEISLDGSPGSLSPVALGKPRRYHPMSMYLLALRVDLATWDPSDTRRPVSSDDDNPF